MSVTRSWSKSNQVCRSNVWTSSCSQSEKVCEGVAQMSVTRYWMMSVIRSWSRANEVCESVAQVSVNISASLSYQIWEWVPQMSLNRSGPRVL